MHLNSMTNLEKITGQKNCELKSKHIEQITELYLDFKETDISKIYPNEYFGYNKITVERPLRLSVKFTEDALHTLRFDTNIADEMTWAYEKFGEDVYSKLKELKPEIEKHLTKHAIKLKSNDKKNLLSQEFWKAQLEVLNEATKLMKAIGKEQHDDFNTFSILFANTIKDKKLKLDNKAQKAILNAITWKNEDAEAVIKKIARSTSSGHDIVEYDPDSDLRDTENVPLDEDIQTYFEREVLQHVPDAWIDHDKTVKGYEVSFTRYFYNYVPPRSIEKITAEIVQLEKETDGILNEIVND